MIKTNIFYLYLSSFNAVISNIVLRESVRRKIIRHSFYILLPNKMYVF